MSKIIDSSDLQSFISGQRDFFETLSALHTMVVVKEPQRIAINNNANTYYGYDETSNVDNYTLSPVSGVFNCMIFTPNKDSNSKTLEQIPVGVVVGDKIIKVEQEAKDFIERGQTERIIIDNNETFTQQSQGFAKTYGTQTYYYFGLKKTA